LLTKRRRVLASAIAAAGTGLVTAAAAQAPALANLRPFPNDSGFAATYSLAGVVDQSGPFFQSMGNNGRSCASCHESAFGWTITPRSVQARFARSDGTDPIFRTVDGSNSPLADVSTPRARRQAYSMLLSKGLIRVGIGIPANAEFELAKVDDPYGYASAGELSLFRRPLPTTNLTRLSTVMWDGRETFKDAASTECVVGTSNCFASISFDLTDQSNVATLGHAHAAAALTPAQRSAIVSFEMGLFTAQGVGSPRRRAHVPRRARRPGGRVAARLLLRHQRHPGRRLPHARAVHAHRDDRLRRLAILGARGRAGSRAR